tara:strand:- start:515 stop:763 length:249 start_codon:yes stop_codon:yes gene_type:complete
MNEAKLFQIQGDQLAQTIAEIEVLARHKDIIIDRLRADVANANLKHLEKSKDSRLAENILRGQYIGQLVDSHVRAIKQEESN